ncbi:methyltransferase domain-containing protein, partial [Salinigranum sp.]|uniref:methyltransferase domain-containing protein n=1 Tax=Salinigranum sp. TaxID=1966351 RepID=UPI00356543A1
MSNREAVLKRWVNQPPDSPIIQHLRDAEREATLDRLGTQSSVLDVASESSLTAALDADDVTRVDFSDEASEYATELLGDDVDEYAVTDPEFPTLPFDDDRFEGAVSVGPLDWKFLDVGSLVDELHRVVGDDGLLVFTVPTPRSPYASDHRNRSYAPTDALGLVSPDWWTRGADQLFQYPMPVHGLINSLPDSMQGPFVDVADELSATLSDRDAWDWASYLVVGATPLDYRSYLDDGLDCLFRPTADRGFWDPDEGKVVRAFWYELDDGTPTTWTLDDRVKWRYAPFALMGAMRWRT